MIKYIVGIDEVGRGPLAGPVAVGVVVVSKNFDWTIIPGVGDSKKVTLNNRVTIFRQAEMLKKAGQLDFAVSSVSAKIIDKKGIVPAIKLAMLASLKKLKLKPAECTVKLDGSLLAPTIYKNQETIVKGDSKEKVIGLASIVAKVTRDRYMVRLGTQADYRVYDFATNKGYGTTHHCQSIKKNGLSDIHRRSFCRSFIQ